ncbi:hypothetical protein COO60DRAFT_1530817 [Scenedesmus sp. NREL 46B-D3]|nr:hypothetical protein COO60DRAFT_1530817 [Scenedesmus sp. NREL 46B-D3]
MTGLPSHMQCDDYCPALLALHCLQADTVPSGVYTTNGRRLQLALLEHPLAVVACWHRRRGEHKIVVIRFCDGEPAAPSQWGCMHLRSRVVALGHGWPLERKHGPGDGTQGDDFDEVLLLQAHLLLGKRHSRQCISDGHVCIGLLQATASQRQQQKKHRGLGTQKMPLGAGQHCFGKSRMRATCIMLMPSVMITVSC